MYSRIKFYIILNLINKFLSGTRFFILKRYLFEIIGIEVGKGTCVVGPLHIGPVTQIKIGTNCWIGKNLNIDGNGKVDIGNNCDLAPHIIINTGGHEIGDSIRRAGTGLVNEIKIMDGVWIGTNVTIINSCTIEKASVIAAGSVVISDVKENRLFAGVPAKMKKVLN